LGGGNPDFYFCGMRHDLRESFPLGLGATPPLARCIAGERLGSRGGNTAENERISDKRQAYRYFGSDRD
jgi:hypothetical protein